MTRRLAALILIGLLSGLASGLNHLAALDSALSTRIILRTLLQQGLLFAAIVPFIHHLTLLILRRLRLPTQTIGRFAGRDVLVSCIFLSTFLGAFGVQFIPPVVILLATVFILLKGLALYSVLDPDQRHAARTSLGYLSFLFLISGFAALIYQIVWQRVLFASFGVNIESITLIVSLFMLGLGVGSLVGGILSSRFPHHAPTLFFLCELGIGLFGIVSIPLIHCVSSATIEHSLFTIALTISALLFWPTLLMGATLPILVNHLYRYYRNVGKSVGILYCINTFGSAIACFLTADVLFIFLGQQASVLVAAACNLIVGILVFRYARAISRQPALDAPPIPQPAAAAP